MDRVYMAFVQATTGSGGWPMSVWLTPTLRAVLRRHLLPARTRPGAGRRFATVLGEIARAWREDRAGVVASATRVVERLRAPGRRPPTGAAAAGRRGARSRRSTPWARAFDERRGGFGDAPKFPRPSELLFLLREYARTGQGDPRVMVLGTLRAMALGGMRDHVGGGFHRYSVDGDWRVPHFEKMLYDQAQLVLAYLEAAQVSGDAFFAQVAEDTLRYVQRDLALARGRFLFGRRRRLGAAGAEPGSPARTPPKAPFTSGPATRSCEALGPDSRVWEMRLRRVARRQRAVGSRRTSSARNNLFLHRANHRRHRRATPDMAPAERRRGAGARPAAAVRGARRGGRGRCSTTR